MLAVLVNIKHLNLIGGSMDNIITRIVGLSDPFTRDHQIRVSILSVCIGQRMSLSTEEIENIRIAGLMHDIGKTTIPIDLLEKTDALEHHERNFVMQHPQAGYEMLLEYEGISSIVKESVLQHHERINGSGYPRRLTGDQMLLEAKIISVADVIDAMAIHRPYNPTQGIDNALEEIAIYRGVHYDPSVVDICVNLFTFIQDYFGTTSTANTAQPLAIAS